MQIDSCLPKIDIHIKKYHKDELIHSQDEEGHSFVRNIYNFFYSSLVGPVTTPSLLGYGPDLLGARNTAGSIFTGVSNLSLNYAGGTDETARGLVLGASDTPYNFNDHFIGEISWNTVFPVVQSIEVAPDLSYIKHYISRSFLNLNDHVLVREVGLISRSLAYNTTTNYLMARDVLATPVEVKNDERVFVDYILTFNNPSAIINGISNAFAYGGVRVTKSALSNPLSSTATCENNHLHVFNTSGYLHQYTFRMPTWFKVPLGAVKFCFIMAGCTYVYNGSDKEVQILSEGFTHFQGGTGFKVIPDGTKHINFQINSKLQSSSHYQPLQIYECWFETEAGHKTGLHLKFGHGPDQGFQPIPTIL